MFSGTPWKIYLRASRAVSETRVSDAHKSPPRGFRPKCETFCVESEAPETPHQSSLFYRDDSFPPGGSLIRPLSFISYRCVKKTWKRFLLPRFWQKSRGMKSFAKLFQKRKINFQKLERYVLCRARSVFHYTPFDLICQQRAPKVNMPKNAHYLLCKTRKFWDFGAKKAGWKALLRAV